MSRVGIITIIAFSVAWPAQSVLAQQSITAIEPVYTAGVPFATTHATPGGSTYFAAGINMSLTFGGERMSVSGYEAGGQRFVPLAIVGDIYLRRNAVGQSNHIVWYRGATAGTNAYNLAGTWEGSMETVFSELDLNRGTDNLFTNSGDTNGNNNNIERLDMIFSGGLVAEPDLAFAVFERGPTLGHDSFAIAAITALDGDGNPSQYAPLLSVSGWGTTNLGSLNTLIERNAATDPNGPAQHPSAWAEQNLGGVSIWVEQDLGVSSGSTFYGYSLFASDVTSGTNLVNYNAFPTNTTSATGGIDLTSFNGVLYKVAVPEPAAAWLASLGALVMVRRRRGQNGAGRPAPR